MTLREYASYDCDDFAIAHHGILGMHWGIRRTPAQLGHPTPKPRRLETGKTSDYKNDGETVRQTYGKGKTKIIQSRNEGSPYAGKSKLVQIAEYHDKKVAEKNAAKQAEKAAKQAKKEANREEHLRRKNLGKRGRIIEDFQKKKGMSEEEATEAADKKIKRDRAIKIGLAIGGAAIVAVGAYQLNKNGVEGMAAKGGKVVGDILGVKERAVNTTKQSARAFQANSKEAATLRKLQHVLPDREKVAAQAVEKYKDIPEMKESIKAWTRRNDSDDLTYGSRANTTEALEEYLSRSWRGVAGSGVTPVARKEGESLQDYLQRARMSKKMY